MTQEKIEDLFDQTLRGNRAKTPEGWWERLGSAKRRAAFLRSQVWQGPIPFPKAKKFLAEWQPVGVPLSANTPDGILESDDHKLIYVPKNGQILKVFSGRYQEHTLTDVLLDTSARILSQAPDELGLGTVQVLKRGAVSYVQIETPEVVKDEKSGVEFWPYFWGATGHDGTLQTQWGLAHNLMVCDNTARAAISEAQRAGKVYKIKHTRHSVAKIAEARGVLNLFSESVDEFTAELHALIADKVSPQRYGRWLDAFMPLPEDEGRARTMVDRQRDKITDLYLSDPRVAPWSGNAFGIFQAVNTFTQHEAPIYKGGARPERNTLQLFTGNLFSEDARALEVLAAVK